MNISPYPINIEKDKTKNKYRSILPLSENATCDVRI